MLEMAIFDVKASESKLGKILKEQDNTFAPLGSGGYSVRQEDKNIFWVQELDCAPARKFKVGIKKGLILIRNTGSDIIASILTDAKINYTFSTKQFKIKSEVRKMFGGA